MPNLLDTPRYDHIVVDTANIATANFYYHADMTYKEKKVGMVYGVFNILLSLIKRFPNTYLNILLEGRSQLRKIKYPDYKAGRLKRMDADGYRESMNDLMVALKLYGCTTWRHDAYEADDIADYLVDGDRSNGRHLLVSNDQDWWKFTDSWNHIFMKGAIYDGDALGRKLGFPVHKLDMYKILRGDKSDNIKPIVPRIPEKAILHFINHERIWDTRDLINLPVIEARPYASWIEKIYDNQDKLIKNAYLVRSKGYEFRDGELEIHTYEPQHDKLRQFLEARNLNYIAERV